MPRTRLAALLALAVAVPVVVAPVAAAAAPLPSGLRVGTSEKAVKDASGRTWAADRGFTGGYRLAPVPQGIAGTHSDALYRGQHLGMSRFRAPLAAGTYRVTLHMAETYWTKPGQRVFDVAAEGRSFAEDVDILRVAGRDRAHRITGPVVVTDGALDLSFTHDVNLATVAGVEAVRTGGVPRTSDKKPARPAPTRTPDVAPVLDPTVAPTTPAPATAPATSPTTTPVLAPEPTSSAPVLAPAPAWKSGASGHGVADGTFAAWRGTPTGVAGTWVDNNVAQVEMWSLLPGAEFAGWKGDLDIAVGAIGWDESWARAAQGAYDARWRTSLTKLKSLWGTREGQQLYIRFAHEMNGSWYPWNVTLDKRDAFVASWKRYRALQEEILPDAKLVFSVNRESVSSMIDWRKTFPGSAYVDVLAVDYYNQWPHAATDAQWDEHMTQVDPWGAPKGLLKHQEFARSVGLPLAVSEWGNNAEWGESPVFMRRMHRFFRDNAGTGPGELLYEVYFNPKGAEGGKWAVWPETRQPSSAGAYQDVF